MIETVPLVEWPLESIWSTATGFVGFMTVAVGAIGLLSRSLSVAIYGSYLTFSYFAVTADIELLTTIFFATFTLIVIAAAFKLVRSEITGDGV